MDDRTETTLAAIEALEQHRTELLGEVHALEASIKILRRSLSPGDQPPDSSAEPSPDPTPPARAPANRAGGRKAKWQRPGRGKTERKCRSCGKTVCVGCRTKTCPACGTGKLE